MYEIRAEIVAQVGQVVVTEGQIISQGDPLVILESMKMEIPVLADKSGELCRLAVGEGDIVSDGDLIALIQ